MEGIAYLVWCLAVGYLLIWVITNERAGSQAGFVGWMAIKRPRAPARDKRPKVAAAAHPMPSRTRRPPSIHR